MKIKQVLKSRTVSLVGGILAGFLMLIILAIYFLKETSSVDLLIAIAIFCSLLSIFISTAESNKEKKSDRLCKNSSKQDATLR
jgi:hypothetical protein